MKNIVETAPPIGKAILGPRPLLVGRAVAVRKDLASRTTHSAFSKLAVRKHLPSQKRNFA